MGVPLWIQKLVGWRFGGRRDRKSLPGSIYVFSEVTEKDDMDRGKKETKAVLESPVSEGRGQEGCDVSSSELYWEHISPLVGFASTMWRIKYTDFFPYFSFCLSLGLLVILGGSWEIPSEWI